MLGKGLLLKTATLLVFFLWLVKFLKVVNNRFVNHLENCDLFLISSMVLGLFDHLQIFLYLIELLGLSTGLGLLKLWHLIYPRLLAGFGMQVFFTNVSLMVMILLSILSKIKHLICGDILNWLLNLNLIYDILWTGVRSGLLISMLGKLSWFLWPV